MPLKIDEIFPDEFPKTLKQFFKIFPKMRYRSVDIINLDRIEFDDPTFLIYVFKGEYVIIDPSSTNVKYVGSELAINSIILIIKDILSGVFSLLHVGQEYEIEECLSQIVIEIITRSQKLKLSIVEPILEVSLFGGFSCGIDPMTTELERGKGGREISRSSEDRDDDNTFSLADLDERILYTGSSGTPDKSNRKGSFNTEQDTEREGDEDSPYLIVNESEVLTLRLLRAFHESKIIFDLRVLCSGSVNTEIFDIPANRKPYPLLANSQSIQDSNTNEALVPTTGKRNGKSGRSQSLANPLNLFSKKSSLRVQGGKKSDSKAAELTTKPSLLKMNEVPEGRVVKFCENPSSSNDIPRRRSSLFSQLITKFVNSSNNRNDHSLNNKSNNQPMPQQNRGREKRSSSVFKLLQTFVTSKFSNTHRRIFHAPKLSAVAYEISSESYFPVTRFLVSSENDKRMNRSEFCRSVDYNMTLVAPNWVSRFSKTCIPMILPDSCNWLVRRPFVCNNETDSDYNNQYTDKPLISMTKIYDNAGLNYQIGKLSLEKEYPSYLCVPFGQTKSLLEPILSWKTGRDYNERRRITLSELSTESFKPGAQTQLNQDELSLELGLKMVAKNLDRLVLDLRNNSEVPLNEAAARDHALVDRYFYTSSTIQPIDVLNDSDIASKEDRTRTEQEQQELDRDINNCTLEYVKHAENGDLVRRLAQQIREALKYLQFDLNNDNTNESLIRTQGEPSMITSFSSTSQDEQVNKNQLEQQQLTITPSTYIFYDLDSLGQWNIVKSPLLTTTI